MIKATEEIGSGLMRESYDGPTYDEVLAGYFRVICESFSDL
jgi:hypothetical protein